MATASPDGSGNAAVGCFQFASTIRLPLRTGVVRVAASRARPRAQWHSAAIWPSISWASGTVLVFVVPVTSQLSNAVPHLCRSLSSLTRKRSDAFSLDPFEFEMLASDGVQIVVHPFLEVGGGVVHWVAQHGRTRPEVFEQLVVI